MSFADRAVVLSLQRQGICKRIAQRDVRMQAWIDPVPAGIRYVAH